MISFQINSGEDKYAVEAAVTLCGSDICVAICGGTHGHIGASAISLPRPSLKDRSKSSSSTSVFCVPGHKEDELARKTAELITNTFSVVSCVTVGLHVDNASEKEIRTLVSNFETIVTAIVSRIKDISGKM